MHVPCQSAAAGAAFHRPGGQPQFGFGLSEARRIRCHAEVARHGQFTTAA